MLGWIVSAIGLVVILVLIWWSAKSPDNGPGAEQARKFRKRGGWSGLGGP